MVAGHLVPQCALVTSQDQAVADAEVSSYEIDISKPVYASYLKVDGLIYVKRLYNSQAGTSNSDVRLFLPAKHDAETSAPVVWVLEDHQGVRKVAFLAPDALNAWVRTKSPAPGLWWRRVTVDESTIIKIQSDVRSASPLAMRNGWHEKQGSTNRLHAGPQGSPYQRHA
jgi:hypothetical protein